MVVLWQEWTGAGSWRIKSWQCPCSSSLSGLLFRKGRLLRVGNGLEVNRFPKQSMRGQRKLHKFDPKA